MMSIIKITKTGIKRRRSEIRYVSFVTLVAVLFMSAITLFQEIANAYVMESNYHNYGDWVISSVDEQLFHPYFAREGYTQTGPELLYEDGESTFLYVGCVDENLAEFGRINLYEGRLPENEQEIAMDILSLAKLGYSYELGQTIIIQFRNEAGTLHKKEYELVGSLMNFAENWRHMDRYCPPNALVTAKSLQGFGCETFTTYFYQFDKDYSRIDVSEFAGSFIRPFSDQLFNTYVYENQVWGTNEIYDMATYVLILISGLAISYLLAIYIGKRRGAYYRLRCMGASKLQIRQMICVEALYAAVPYVVAGLVMPYMVGYIICAWLAKKNGMQNFFVLDTELLGKQLGMIGLVLVVAILAAQISTSDKRLAANTGSIKPFWYSKLRKRAKQTRNLEKVLLNRYEMTRPLQNLMSVLMTILICGGLVVCFDNICQAIVIYYRSTNNYPDFELTMESKYYYQTQAGAISGTTQYLYHGIDDELKVLIEQVPGVRETEYHFYDRTLYLEWEGKESSSMIQAMKAERNVETTEYELGAVTNIYSSKEDVGVLPDEDVVDSKLDWTAWQSGEQIIVLLQTSYYDWEGANEIGESPFRMEKLTIYDDTIRPGDLVRIKNLETNLDYPITVGAVYHITDYKDSTQSYKIIMSKALAEKLAKADGMILEPTDVTVNFNQLASFEATEKTLAKLADENELYYSSYMEMKRMQYQNMLQKVCIYGCIMVMLIVVYIVLQKSFWNSTTRYRQENYRILKQIGMTDVQYKKLARRQAIQKYLWLYVGMVLGYGMVFYIQFQQTYREFALAGGNLRQGSELLNEMTDNIWILSLEYVLLDMQHVGVILLVTLLFMLMVWSTMQTVNKYVEESR